MDVKLFEVRDRATFIPVMAIALGYSTSKSLVIGLREKWLLRRAGYGEDQLLLNGDIESLDEATGPYVLLTKLDGGETRYDPFQWNGGGRTLPCVHRYVIEHWADLVSGALIDVEFINGETDAPKESELLRG